MSGTLGSLDYTTSGNPKSAAITRPFGIDISGSPVITLDRIHSIHL